MMRRLFRQRQTDFLNGVIYQQILLFFIPIFFGTLFQQLYNTVDAIIVGNIVGKQALGAVGGSTGTVINLLVNFVTGVSSGATVVIAQFYGKGDRAGVKKGVDSGIFLAVMMGILLTVVGMITAPGILRMLNVPEDMYAFALTYMRIYYVGLIPTLIYNTGAGILRATGDSRRPLYFLMVSCLVNIILDIALVAWIPLGVAGAAIATVISQLASCYLTLRVLRNSEESYQFSFRTMKLDVPVLRQIIKIGLPTGIQSALYAIANLFIQASVNSYGTDTVAAYTAFGKVDALFWNYSGALGTSVMTFVGQNFGAGNIERLKKGIREGAVLYIIGAGLISFFCLTFGNAIYHLFTNDPEVLRIGMELMRFIAPWWATFVAVEILSSSIRACGDSLNTMIITALGIGFFRIVWILFYPGKTVFDTLRCYPISWVLTGILFIIYYLNGAWLRRSLKQREKLIRANN